MTVRELWEGAAEAVAEGSVILEHAADGSERRGKVCGHAELKGRVFRISDVRWDNETSAKGRVFEAPLDSRTVRVLASSVLIGSTDSFWTISHPARDNTDLAIG